MTIHVIGNSHVGIFGGNTYGFWNTEPYTQDDVTYRIHHLGATIAYNFYEHHFPRVRDIIKACVNKETDYIMFVVGEVDCRWHLPKQAELQKRDPSELASECVSRFFKCYQELQSQGYKLITYGSHPSTTEGHSDVMDSPIYGDCFNRNKISRAFASSLQQLSEIHNIPFVSILETLIDENGLTKMEYFADYCHLKGDIMLPIITQAIKDKLKL